MDTSIAGSYVHACHDFSWNGCGDSAMLDGSDEVTADFLNLRIGSKKKPGWKIVIRTLAMPTILV
jgi:hypothetical protein